MNKMSANKELATFGLDELREDTEDHRQKLARWAKDNVARLRTKVKHTDVPKDIRSMNSRAFENWRPLFAIADLAGEDLAMRIRDSARFILKKDEGDDWATELLKELHRYFIETGADKIHTEDFVKDLNDQEDGPWVTYCGGFPIKPTNIAKYMKKFQVKSKDVRIGSIVRKGYHLRTVAPVFARYLAPETLQTLQPSNHNEKQPTGKRYNVADTESVALNGKANGTGKHSGVANVADTGQGSGDGLDLPWENPDFGKKEKSSAYNEGLEK